MPFIDEQVDYLKDEGVGNPGVVIWVGTKAPIPATGGPFLHIRETGGTDVDRTHDGGYQRPSAQLVALGADMPSARILALKAYYAYVDRNTGLYRVRNRLVGASQFAITSLTQVGGVATATTASNHRYLTGTRVSISGATQPEYNVTERITVIAPNQFTYPIVGNPASPATGAPIVDFLGTWYREITVAQEPTDMGLDPKDRVKCGFNIRAVKRPS